MTEQEQRIAIAEACGWKREKVFGALCGGTYEAWRKDGHRIITSNALPNYLHDLNAMHEAEETLTGSEQVAFCIRLRESACGKPKDVQMFYAYHATAAQRAEAFLKTKGLWK